MIRWTLWWRGKGEVGGGLFSASISRVMTNFSGDNVEKYLETEVEKYLET